MVEVRVPGADSYLEILRGTAGRVARLAGMTYNGIEDFALAVDEAAVLLLENRPREIVMVVSLGAGEGLEVEMTLVAPGEKWPPPGLEADTRWKIIGAMCERIWLLEGGAGIGLAQSIW